MATNPPIVPVLEALAPQLAGSLRNEGGWQSLRCPFHEDKNASARYNPEEGKYRCFACEIWGNAYDVVKEVEKVDFATAQQRVQEITGIGRSTLRGKPQSGNNRILERPRDNRGSSARPALSSRYRYKGRPSPS